jgi:Flp pilus assembly protein TadD
MSSAFQPAGRSWAAPAFIAAALVAGGCATRAPATALCAAGCRGIPSVDAVETRDAGLAAARIAWLADPTPAHARQLAGEYQRLAIFDQADGVLTDALDRWPSDGTLHEGRARVWRDWGLPALALPHAQRALYFAAGSTDAANTLASILEALGRFEEAGMTLEAAASGEPGDGVLAANRCYVALERGLEGDALALCREALQLAPDSAHARNNLALVHAAAGRLDEATRLFVEANGEADGLFNIGIVRLARREYEEAAAAFDAAVTARPGFAAAASRAAEARRLAAARAGAR